MPALSCGNETVRVCVSPCVRKTKKGFFAPSIYKTSEVLSADQTICLQQHDFVVVCLLCFGLAVWIIILGSYLLAMHFSGVIPNPKENRKDCDKTQNSPVNTDPDSGHELGTITSLKWDTARVWKAVTHPPARDWTAAAVPWPCSPPGPSHTPLPHMTSPAYWPLEHRHTDKY